MDISLTRSLAVQTKPRGKKIAVLILASKPHKTCFAVAVMAGIEEVRNANFQNEADLHSENEIGTQQSRSFNELKTPIRTHLPLKKSKSWACSPTCNGIPLGSLTAQAAARPFWGKDMLQERIQEIAEYAALETSSLGSSIDDNLSTTELEDLEECNVPNATFNISNEDELNSSRSTPSVPRHHSPEAVRSQSAQPIPKMSRRETAKSLPPSPHSRSRARSANSSSSRLVSSMTGLSIEGKRMPLSPRNSTRALDDGFHEK